MEDRKSPGDYGDGMSTPSEGCPAAVLVDLVAATQGAIHRPIHAAGIGLAGSFTPAPDATKFSSAAIFAGDPTPVTVRFSDGVGRLGGDQRKPDIRGFATRFHVGDDPASDLDMIAMTLPTFFASTPESFEAFTRVMVPSVVTGVPDADAITEWVRENPTSQYALGFVRSEGIEVSYGSVDYFSVHAFNYTNSGGDTTCARFLWKPDHPQARLPRDANLSHQPPDRLRRGITAQARAGDAPGFALIAQIQGPDDPSNDPTVPWQSQNFLPLGHLQLGALVDDQYWGCEALHFNPTRLIDGIALSDDPILAARGDAYEVSADRRCAAYPAPMFDSSHSPG